MEEIEREIKRIINEYKGEKIIIGRDFNIRIGELGGDEEVWSMERKSKDKKIGNGGYSFIEFMQKWDLEILNGKINGDWEGEYTYLGLYLEWLERFSRRALISPNVKINISLIIANFAKW